MSESPKPTEDHETAEEKGKGNSHNKRASAAALIDTFAQQYQADRKEAGRREGHRIFREWLTIIGLFLAAVVALLQWRELRSTDHSIGEQATIAGQQLTVMQGQLDAMMREQEPHILAKPAEPGFQLAVSSADRGAITWTIEYENSGKGIANDITVNTYMRLESGPFIRSNPMLRPEPVRTDELLSGAQRFLTISSPFTTTDQFAALKGKDLGISIFIEFLYSDTDGKHYITAYCMGRFANGAITNYLSADCRKHIQE